MIFRDSSPISTPSWHPKHYSKRRGGDRRGVSRDAPRECLERSIAATSWDSLVRRLSIPLRDLAPGNAEQGAHRLGVLGLGEGVEVGRQVVDGLARPPGVQADDAQVAALQG